MPIVNIEVAATHCDIATHILDAGIASFQDAQVQQTFQYTCVEQAQPALTNWQMLLSIYLVVMIPALIVWAILYRKGLGRAEFFKWGVASFLMPVLAPFAALVYLAWHPVDSWPDVKAGLQIESTGRSDADD